MQSSYDTLGAYCVFYNNDLLLLYFLGEEKYASLVLSAYKRTVSFGCHMSHVTHALDNVLSYAKHRILWPQTIHCLDPHNAFCSVP